MDLSAFWQTTFRMRQDLGQGLQLRLALNALCRWTLVIIDLGFFLPKEGMPGKAGKGDAWLIVKIFCLFFFLSFFFIITYNLYVPPGIRATFSFKLLFCGLLQRECASFASHSSHFVQHACSADLPTLFN